LQSFDEHGFIFYTNYDSRKSRELKENPKASMVFYWEPLQRTIRIEGDVEMISEDQSTHYFQSRPRDSQIGAWASPCQSGVVKDRDEIEQRKKVK
jgi:pyridoxamine 5'-phosphate oxidase